MEWVLVLLGLLFIVASFILAKKQQRDYERVQEELLASVVDAGVIELQTLQAELSEQLAAQFDQFVIDFETRTQKLVESTQAVKPPQVAVEEETEQADPLPKSPSCEQTDDHNKLGLAIGAWGERERLIRQMHRFGMDVEAIAKELNIGKGEVRLVLDLARHEEVGS